MPKSSEDDYKFLKLKGEKYAYRILADSLVVSDGKAKFTRVHKNGDFEEFDFVGADQIEYVREGGPMKDDDAPIL